MGVTSVRCEIANLFLQIKDSMGNDHGRPKDIVGEVRQAFTSTADTAFDVCMVNKLVGRSKSPKARVGISPDLRPDILAI